MKGITPKGYQHNVSCKNVRETHELSIFETVRTPFCRFTASTLYIASELLLPSSYGATLEGSSSCGMLQSFRWYQGSSVWGMRRAWIEECRPTCGTRLVEYRKIVMPRRRRCWFPSVRCFVYKLKGGRDGSSM